MDQILTKALGLLVHLRVNGPVVGEEIPHQPVDECRSRQALLNQKWVFPQNLIDLPEPLGHARFFGHPFQLPPQQFAGDRGGPEGIESDRLLQVGSDLVLQHRAWDRLFEGLGRTDLVRVVDALNGLLRLDPIFEC